MLYNALISCSCFSGKKGGGTVKKKTDGLAAAKKAENNEIEQKTDSEITEPTVPETDEATQEAPPTKTAENQRANNRRQGVFSRLAKWISAALLLGVVLLNLFTHVFTVVRYNGTGMEPYLNGGQTLVIRKTATVKQGDVIAFYYNNRILIRRVIALGGSQVELDEAGALSINGSPVDEPYVREATRGQCNLTFPHYVQPNTVFVMGDNREESMDSRLEEIGTIPQDRIIGTVLLIL